MSRDDKPGAPEWTPARVLCHVVKPRALPPHVRLELLEIAAELERSTRAMCDRLRKLADAEEVDA